MRVRVMPDEVRVGDVLPDPHFEGTAGKVVEIVPTPYGCSIKYEYGGGLCGSGVFFDGITDAAGRYRPPGIEVER
jgi:hypothetical protein